MMKLTAKTASIYLTLATLVTLLGTGCAWKHHEHEGDEDDEKEESAEKGHHHGGKHEKEDDDDDDDEAEEKGEHHGKKAAKGDDWKADFGLAERKLSPTGENPFFILKPGFQIVLASADAKVEITVLDETKVVGGVTTRVVEEREWSKGEIEEISRNFFAIDEVTKDVFYFGEDVDMYKDGKVVKNDGAWRADEPGNKAGLAMPGTPKVGEKYYQEIAPGKALDRGEIVSLNETLVTPAGTFKNCVKTMETSGLNPAEKEFKHYAPGVGQIQDEELLLTKYGYIDKK